MELNSANNVKGILEKFDAKPKKNLGQNFLIDKNILQKIINSSDIKPDDIILEVGPGVGTLTQELTKIAKRVIAVEKDNTMCKILKESLKNYKNIEIINADILKFQIKEKKYKVIANIPYYLTSPLIRKFLENANPSQEIILMVQKEVAQRICAKIPDMNLLAVSVQFYAKPKILFNVSKNSFWPVPKIDSAVIKITPHKNSDNISPDLFFKIVKAGFSHPRKQIAGNLSKSLKMNKKEITEWLIKNNLSPTQRAETLTIQDWRNLARDILSNATIDKNV
jgi:16S rRNA (adenine1518-N6/adenine1519-N6)-dimethyltransferase